MATSFTVKQLPKTDGSLTRSPNFHKYFIKCSGRITPETPTSEPWLHVLRLIKTDISDIDKSRILLGSLQKYGEIVVKIGDSESMHYEYTNSTRVHSLKGFVKYICYFSCEDDFRSIPSPSRTSICKGPGESMGVILMPYFELGSLAKFVWSNALAHVFQSCLKHAFLSIVILFQKSNLIHGDFHPGNVLLKRTKQSEVLYAVPGVGEFSIKTHGLRTWIMDFENMRYAEYSPIFAVIKSFNDFYYDIQKFFMLLYNTIKNLDQRTISPILSYLSKKSIDSNYLSKADIDTIFAYVDAIKFIY
jgi:hypothetical protein